MGAASFSVDNVAQERLLSILKDGGKRVIEGHVLPIQGHKPECVNRSLILASLNRLENENSRHIPKEKSGEAKECCIGDAAGTRTESDSGFQRAEK